MPNHTTPIKPASWSYAETFVAEDELLAAARSRAVGGAHLSVHGSLLDSLLGALARLWEQCLVLPHRRDPC